jgi:hypothetical protein
MLESIHLRFFLSFFEWLARGFTTPSQPRAACHRRGAVESSLVELNPASRIRLDLAGRRTASQRWKSTGKRRIWLADWISPPARSARRTEFKQPMDQRVHLAKPSHFA